MSSAALSSPATSVMQRHEAKLALLPDDYYPQDGGYWFELPHGEDAGKKMFFYDFCINTVSADKTEKTILFVHGNPECSFTYSKIRDQLQTHGNEPCRIIAMDHIGFGLSDAAHYQMIDFHHAANLKQLIEALELKNITLVIHDWGGAIGIGSVIDSPERIANIVLMNTTVFPLPLDLSRGAKNYTNFPLKYLPWHGMGYLHWKIWRHVPSLVLFSQAGTLNLFKRLGSYLGRLMTGRLTADEKLYLEMFSDKNNVISSRRNVRHTQFWGHGYCYYDDVLGWQDNRDFYKNMQQKIAQVWPDIGVRAFFGEYDPLAQESVQQQWLQALPQLKGHIQTFADAGHFVEETKYAEIARGIIDVAEL